MRYLSAIEPLMVSYRDSFSRAHPVTRGSRRSSRYAGITAALLIGGEVSLTGSRAAALALRCWTRAPVAPAPRADERAGRFRQDAWRDAAAMNALRRNGWACAWRAARLDGDF